jgi:hypothetical protein
LVLDPGTRVTLTAGFTGAMKHSALTIDGGTAPTAKLDVTSNGLVVDYTGASPLATIKAQIIAGYNGGGANAWTGNGIMRGDGDANHFAIGYAEAMRWPACRPISARSIPPPCWSAARATAMRTSTAPSTSQTSTRWRATSDRPESSGTRATFNYDGLVNLADFNLLAGNFGLSAAGSDVTPQDWANLAAEVPEPASLCVIGLGALALRRRRGKRNACVLLGLHPRAPRWRLRRRFAERSCWRACL